MEKRSITLGKSATILPGVLILLGLYLTSLYSYLLFHSLAEIFSIVVACAILVLAWNARRFLDSNYLLFIGIAYLFVAGLDLLHTLAYKGMGVFEGEGANLPTQLWIAARYLQSISLLIAPLFLGRKLKSHFVSIGYAVVISFLLGSLFYWRVFPDCYVEGVGLTPFKKVSEYLISLILLASIALLLQKRREFDRSVLRLLVLSIVFTIGAELAFTFYISVYDLSNLIGHFFKIISFYLIYKAIVETGLMKPHNILFRNLKQNEEALRNALMESQQRQAEISALLEGSRAVLEYREFKSAARSMFDSCKRLIGATAGYVAQLSEDGTRNEVVFLDSGGLTCTVDPSLPMPIRGLREEAYRTGKVVCQNDFAHSQWIELMPEGHVSLDNVLFAPLVIEGKVFGLLGLANKPGGFTENDVRMASAFGELAAVSLLNSRTLESLKSSEERFRSVAQTANDAIITIDSRGNVVFWNDAAGIIFGRSADEIVGKPLAVVIPERLREAHQEGMNRVISTGKSKLVGQTIEMSGLRKDGSKFPLELSLATWKTREGTFFTAIIRDITERRRAEEALRQHTLELKARNEELDAFAHTVAHDLRNPLALITSSTNLLNRHYATLSDEERREFLQPILQTASKMSNIIDELLLLAEIRKAEVRVEPLDIAAIVAEAQQRLAYMIEEHRSEVILSNDWPVALGHGPWIEEVWVNYLSNAIRYGGQPPRVELGATTQPDGMIRFWISDNGPGLTPEDQAQLFTPFTRLDQVHIGGYGLGLSIVRRIVEKLGGQVGVESEVGRGSVFFFTLPGTLDQANIKLDRRRPPTS